MALSDEEAALSHKTSGQRDGGTEEWESVRLERKGLKERKDVPIQILQCDFSGSRYITAAFSST